jgi:hypothetical protein
VACVLASGPPGAAAQERRPTPSADHLWREYPLEATPEAGAQPTASAAAQPRGDRSPPAASRDSGPPIVLLVAAGLALAGAVALGVHLARTRPRRAPAGGALARGLGLPSPLLSVPVPHIPMRTERSQRLALAASSDRQRSRRFARRPPGSPPAVPPDPEREWSAEIEWQRGAGGSRFRLVAISAATREKHVLRTSEPLEWPPSTPDTVDALNRAVDALTAGALAAGWEGADPGRAWYARRFRWRPPVTAPAKPAARSAEVIGGAPPAVDAVADRPQAPGGPRLARAVNWPEGSAELHRGEITWHGGYVNSHFRVILHRPGRRRGRAIARSKPFKWLLMGDPDPNAPEFRSELERLARAMEAAGWEPVGLGPDWFSHRFVWRDGDPPPGLPEADADTDAEKRNGSRAGG